jgi:mannose-1-phosphate guanylyltransferase
MVQSGENMMDHLYALILAGGGGTRLWPLSRKTRPKQMLPLLGESSMFQMAVDRLDPLLPPERIFVVTGPSLVDQLCESAPDVPCENFIVEPFGRDSGPAVGLGVLHIRNQDPQAIIAVLTADQYIADTEKFRNVLAAAAQLAQQNYIVTLGISPSYPATGFGYIKRGEPLAELGGFQVYHSEGFTEKPNTETAIQFITSGLYSWNSGMFIWTVDRVMGEFARQEPGLYEQFLEIGRSIGRDDYQQTLERVWSNIKKIPVDYAVMEGAPEVAVIPVDMGWSDIGSWSTLFEVLDGDLDGNVSRGGQEHVKIDTKETLIVSNRMVVTIGIEDIVIVDTDDVMILTYNEHGDCRSND